MVTAATHHGFTEASAWEQIARFAQNIMIVTRWPILPRGLLIAPSGHRGVRAILATSGGRADKPRISRPRRDQPLADIPRCLPFASVMPSERLSSSIDSLGRPAAPLGITPRLSMRGAARACLHFVGKEQRHSWLGRERTTMPWATTHTPNESR
jgi:hypothetical protein